MVEFRPTGLSRISLLFAFCLISISWAYSQRNEIGIAATTLGYSHTNDSASDTNFIGKTDALSVQPVLTFNHVTAKNTDYFIHVGFFYLPGSDNGKNSNPTSGVYSKANTLKKSTYLKLGTAKRFEVGKLLLIAGVNISFEYQFFL